MSLVDAFLQECREDYVGLWSILWDIRSDNPNDSTVQHRQKTLEVVRELLDAGMQVGEFSPDHVFRGWPVSPEQAVQRIAFSWETLGRDPTIGDICWLTAPSGGGAE